MSVETFFALVPSSPLWDFVAGCKAAAREVSGPQRYLEDTPHLTLAVGHYEDAPGLAEAVRGAMPDLGPGLRLAGWKTFPDDPMTGGQTLVLEPAPEDKGRLREFQVRLLAATALYRTSPFAVRYADRSRFTPAMRAALDRHGYPFVGEGWEPHLTVASFTAEAYPKVRKRLAGLSPPETAGFAALALYGILPEGGFIALRRWEMGESGT